MPMDIRNFFGKKPAEKNATPKPKPIKTKENVKQKNGRNEPPKQKEPVMDDSKDDDSEKVKASSKHFAKSHEKKKVIVDDIDDDDGSSDTDDGFPPPKKKSSPHPPKQNKRKAASQELSPKEVSPKDFFADAATTSSMRKSPPKKPKEEETLLPKVVVEKEDASASPPPRASPPRRAAAAKESSSSPSKRKRFREEESEKDNESDEDYKEEPMEQDEDDEDYVVETKPKSSPKTKSSPQKKPTSPPKSSTPARTSPPKRARATTPSQKKPETPKKPARLEPTLELERFDLDSVQVPEMLQGLTFVFTGVLEELHRDAAADLIKSLGGRVTTSVSGKTDYLVVGPLLEDGRPYDQGKKYQAAAVSKNNTIIVMGEKKLYGLCHLFHERVKQERGIIIETTTTPKESSSSTPKKQEPAASNKPTTPAATTNNNPYAKKTAVANPYANKTAPAAAAAAAAANPYAKKAAAAAPDSNPYSKAAANPYAKKSSNPYANNKSTTSNDAAAQASATKNDTGNNNNNNNLNQLWVDRHAPKHTREILGNKENVTKLSNWLKTWEKNFNNAKVHGKTFSNPKGPWKAALLSGPPGIGKTTTATLVAKEDNRDLLEFNASDARSKKALQNNLGDITGSQALNFGVPKNKNAAASKKQLRCIIMDEVDGMGAGDRSGMAELIQMIKKSKVPIICICNDRQSQKMKSLLPYCMDLRFKRPVKSIMANRVVRIAEMEGLKVERNAAEAIAESCGNDVRQVLNCLQMWSQKQDDGALTYKGLKEREHSINKDEILRVSLFDAAKKIMEGRTNLSGADRKAERDSLFKRSDAFFVDYSLVGLLVQQNYPKVMLNQFNNIKRAGDAIKQQEFLERLHEATASMSDFAVVEHEIRTGDHNWSLLPTCGIMAVKTGYHAGGETGGFLPGYPEFTAWMGKNSTKGKKMRLLSELHYHMNFKVSGDSQQLRESYLPVLRDQFLKILKSGDEGASTKAIALMDEYGLSREDVIEKLDEFRMGKGESFAEMDSKQKAALTREYNQGSHKSQALVAEQGGASKPKRGGGKKERDPADLDAIDEDIVEEESDEEDTEEELKKLQDKFRKKGRKSSGNSKKKSSKGKKKK